MVGNQQVVRDAKGVVVYKDRLVPIDVVQKIARQATASTSAIHRAISAQQDTDHAAEAVTVWSDRARKVFVQIHQPGLNSSRLS